MYDNKKIDMLKKLYPAGTRIKLIYMDDIDAVKPGTCGTVIYVDDMGQLIVEWDNGRGLNLNPDVDDFRVI